MVDLINHEIRTVRAGALQYSDHVAPSPRQRPLERHRNRRSPATTITTLVAFCVLRASSLLLGVYELASEPTEALYP